MADPAISLSKEKGISLSKEKGLTLDKDDAYTGELQINLNCSQPSDHTKPGIDLDLCCLYEMKDGKKGSVQALGNLFGSLETPPYLKLDGDDRTGESLDGENIILNMDKVQFIQRLLVFAHIYAGTPDWKTANPVVTLKCPGHRDIIVEVDAFGSNTDRICAIALLENHGDKTFKLTKEVRFFANHKEMDTGFNWGISWVPCSKD